MKITEKYFLSLFCICLTLYPQEKQTIRCKVTYIAASVIYLDAGREEHVAIGDTLQILRKGKPMAKVLVTAVSKHSSAAQVLSQDSPVAIADEGVVQKELLVQEIKKDTANLQQATEAIPAAQFSAAVIPSNKNLVSGRVGIQYSGVTANDNRFNLNQPSVIVRLDVRNIFGTGMVFSMYGRNSYDLAKNISRFGGRERLRNRMYEFLLHHDDPNATIGYGIGRMTSRYVGGLGAFDGGHFFYRTGNVTTGVMAGARVDDLSYTLNDNDNKGAVFINYQYGSVSSNHYDGTLAYGQQLVKGKLDREFLYLQNFFSLGTELSLYESTEIELNDINNGVRTKAFKLSNTFLSVNYYPYQWLSLNAGYDGSRSIYLFETMKAFPDTLFDKNLMQGCRGSVTVRFPYFISLSGNLSYRTKKGDAREPRTLSGTFRISDIAGTGIGGGIRYAEIIGVYSNGENVTVDVARTLCFRLSLALRYDYYRYTILATSVSYLTQTFTLSGNYRVTKMVYAALNTDYISEIAMNSFRIFFEIGIRF